MDAPGLVAATGVPVLLAAITAAITAAVTGWISGGQASRRTLKAATLVRRQHAAAALREAAQDLQDLLWDAYTGVPVDAPGIADAMMEFERLARRHEDLLPEGARHLRRSTREAMCCVLGAPAVAALDAHARHEPVDALSSYWTDVSLTWLEHAARRLHDWEDKPRSRRVELVPYHQWDEDDAARADGRAASRAANAYHQPE